MGEYWEVEQAHKYIDELFKKITVLEAKSKMASFDFAGKKIMSLLPYKMPGVYFDIDHLDSAQKKADDLYTEDKLTRAKNNSISANNKEIKDALVTLMMNLGFSETTRRVKSRKRYTQYETVKAEWREYIDLIPIDQYVTKIDEIYKSWCDQISRKRAEIQKQKENSEKKREADEHEREKLKLLVSLGMKYQKDFDCLYSAIRHILEKDKYLALAYYLEKNRGDWSDGCDYARTGISMFKIETPEDHLIFKEITDICSDFEDGRSFRDCEWNYGKLYTMANQSLLEDINRLKEFDEL